MPARKTTTVPQALVVSFSLERETKGTFRFAEQNAWIGEDAAQVLFKSATDRPSIGTEYITKEALAAAGIDPEKYDLLATFVAVEKS